MAQNNQNIKIDFPDKVRVTSPEIDSISKVSERISNWLHNDLRNIIEPLTVLKFVPDLIKEVRETIVTQFTNLMTGQVETEVINRQATIKVLNRKIVSVQKHVGQKEENMDKTVGRINNRYNLLSDDLNREHETFLKKLDSHAYEIIEKVYPHQVQERFSYDALPCTNFLTEHAMVSVTDRNACLSKGYEAAEREVSGFLELRNIFHGELEEYHCSDLDEGAYDMPFCFVEMENRHTGETKIECWFECELEHGGKITELEFLRTEMESRAMENRLTSNRFETILETFDGQLDETLIAQEKQRFMDDMKSNLKNH